MNTEIIQHYAGVFGTGGSLAEPDADALFDAMISETDEAPLAELLTNWEIKRPSSDELLMLARIMRSRMKRLGQRTADVLDIVGTGGSRAKTFNVSTAAAFVVAGAGIAVAKHGNRAATSSSGSADVLADLGIKVDVSPDVSAACLDEIGVCFMYAPLFHSLSPRLAKVRRGLGRPTIFNSLGPLCNPAGAQFKMIGVWSDELLDAMSDALLRLGTTRAWLVHGAIGLDEIALVGETHVIEVTAGGTSRKTITAADFGIEPAASLLKQSVPAEESAALIREILENRQKNGDAEKLVLMNAAAAIYVEGKCGDLRSAYQAAETSVRSGAALAKLEALKAATNL